MFLFKNRAENEVARLVPDYFFFLKKKKKPLCKVKAIGRHLNINIFW